MNILKILLTTALLLSLPSCALVGRTSAPKTEIEQAKPYPFEGCIVSQKKFGMFGPKHVKVVDGQVVKFCCDPCVTVFNSSPDHYMAKIKEAQVKAEQ